jgi:hypothetical protein
MNTSLLRSFIGEYCPQKMASERARVSKAWQCDEPFGHGEEIS